MKDRQIEPVILTSRIIDDLLPNLVFHVKDRWTKLAILASRIIHDLLPNLIL